MLCLCGSTLAQDTYERPVVAHVLCEDCEHVQFLQDGVMRFLRVDVEEGIEHGRRRRQVPLQRQL